MDQDNAADFPAEARRWAEEELLQKQTGQRDSDRRNKKWKLHQNPHNARFWVYWNGGWCKLTLRPDQTVTLFCRGQHEEGYAETAESYTHGGSHVLSENDSYSSDCDGPHEHHSVWTCDIDKLQEVSAFEDYPEPENRDIWKPLWQKQNAWQRDVFAESMGY